MCKMYYISYGASCYSRLKESKLMFTNRLLVECEYERGGITMCN